MAVARGTNAGFVSSAPSADPDGSAGYSDKGNASLGTRHTSPSGSNTVTEIGWWSDMTGEDATFNVALYSNQVSPGPRPNVVVGTIASGSKGTTAGWKKAAYDSGALDASTDYWVVYQCDDTTTNIKCNDSAEAGYYCDLGSQTQLYDTWPGSGEGTGAAYAVYALYEAAGGVPIANMMYHYMHH